MKEALIKSLRGIQKKDIAFSDSYLSKTPFHSAFWSHIRIRKAIIANSHYAKGDLLDIGCGTKPYEKVFAAASVQKHLGLEYSPESGYWGNRADVYGDAAALPFSSESVDTILCTEVMEHVPDPEKVIAEFARVLRPGGVVITTAPFFYPIHDEFDFFRYTDKGLAEIMKRYGLAIETVQPLSGTGVTIALLFNIYWYDLGFIWTKWLYPFGLILRPLLLLLVFAVNMLGWIGEKLLPSNQMSFNHLTVARKPLETQELAA